MKKIITVRKNTNQRTAIRLILACYFMVVVVLIAIVQQYKILYFMMCSIPLVWLIPLLIYFETWKVILAESYICKSVFFTTGKKYSYYQIKYAEITWSYTERKYVEITFDDQKAIFFRIEDEDAHKAIKQISHFCSIKRNI